MSADNIQRAVLSGTDGSDLQCQFNPSTVQITKTSHWNAQPTRGSTSTPRPQFVGTGPEVLTAKLLFDDFDDLGGGAATVPDAVKTLLGWTCVPAQAYQNDTPQPPIVTFQWGSGITFTGFLQQVQIQYTMFAPRDGTPLRAIATISLHSIPNDPAGTNPTSGGISGRRSAVLEDCDGLAAIAYREYGDAALWRGIAIANGIEDPARVPVGARLLVPPRTQAAQLSQTGGERSDAS
jgi:Contractile injection system tube protein